MLKNFSLLLLCLLFPISLSFAQSGNDEPMTAFDFLEGDWKVSQTLYSEQDGWSDAELSETHFSDSLNGKLTSGVIKFKTGSFEMEVLVSISYDHIRDINRVSLMDDIEGLLDIYEGRIYNNNLIATNIAANTWFPGPNGTKRFFRLGIENADESAAKIIVDTSLDRGLSWAPYIKWDMTRK